MRVERVETAHGTCVLVELADPAAARARLPAAEQAHAEARRAEFVVGRCALHEALGDWGVAVLADDRGAPVLPAGWVGSVSHKGAVAAALVAPAGQGFVGVDLERAAPPRADIARRILTPREQAALAHLAGDERGRALTLRFAIKEAIYKAIDPHLRRYVGFLEVELELAGADCLVTSQLPLVIDAAWCEHAGHWLATARATPR
jgi:4'-phosphopantetheinyl transferase EntD